MVEQRKDKNFQSEKKKISFDEGYRLISSYYNYYGHLKINQGFKTLNGYDYDEYGVNLYNWLSNEKQNCKHTVSINMAYHFGFLSEERFDRISSLKSYKKDSEILKMIKLGVNICSGSDTKHIKKQLCEKLNLDYSLFKDHSYSTFELFSKARYLEDIDLDMSIDGKPHEIFFLNNNELYEKYNVTIPELIENYYIKEIYNQKVNVISNFKREM